MPYQLNPKTNNLGTACSTKTSCRPNEALSKTFKVVMGLPDRGMALHKQNLTQGRCSLEQIGSLADLEITLKVFLWIR